ncbi:MAG: 2-phospho-L-lactate transferase CofD family protein [Candidatus Colwellbacteria bacterium]|nr:2-phospho-L-lactate transferase CofD family protein [Candidatus Colwellbacteria bacterium]
MIRMVRVVTIGGGGGHAQVLKSLKSVKNIQITGICPSTDTGGSTGILVDDYNANGYLGDLTKCMAALCKNEVFGKALMYRYGKGDLYKHSVKNILLLALEKVAGVENGLSTLNKLCELDPHKVIPVTRARTKLYATLKLGNKIESETDIDNLAKNPLWHPSAHAIKDIYLRPKVFASNEVSKSISNSDWIIICPGDFYTSILPTLLPGGVKESIKKSKAKIILILNVVNKRGETDSYTAEQYVSLVEKHVGRRVNFIFCNNKDIPPKALINYTLEDKVFFKPSTKKKDKRIRYGSFVEIGEEGLLRHNPVALNKELKKVIFS